MQKFWIQAILYEQTQFASIQVDIVPDLTKVNAYFIDTYISSRTVAKVGG